MSHSAVTCTPCTVWSSLPGCSGRRLQGPQGLSIRHFQKVTSQSHPPLISRRRSGGSSLTLLGRHTLTGVSLAVRAETEAETAVEDGAKVEAKPPVFPPGSCAGCGRPEGIAFGCNGEGRMQGGLGAVPGFRWFPIKAYRPCPSFVEAGLTYTRKGQSFEEVAFGRAGEDDSLSLEERLDKLKKDGK